ncbi:unnamed protein product [Oikopleura dioica]|uniref:Uncharacterized protein n=1 Tax=Oikopleura dioica TaxID=34765 RepID=E4XJB7_OIKDI|nr:unnamed protein product [Oikopleura dioica]
MQKSLEHALLSSMISKNASVRIRQPTNCDFFIYQSSLPLWVSYSIDISLRRRAKMRGKRSSSIKELMKMIQWARAIERPCLSNDVARSDRC